MYYRKVNPELKDICQLIVGGLDENLHLLPEDYRDIFKDEQKTLEYAKRIAKTVGAGDDLSNLALLEDYLTGEYSYNYEGNQQYKLRGFHHKIILSEQEIRNVVIGKLDKLPIMLNPDFISD